MKTVFTSESVTEGHPDKICDRISDAILDELLRTDPDSRCACETLVKDNRVVLAGEITSKARPDYAAIARRVADDVGYTADCGFYSGNIELETLIREQSPDIALGVDSALESKSGGEAELGAGDQGMMFGYACDETPELMPLSASLAHRLCRRLTLARKSGELPWLRPDGKSQVTVEYKNGAPARLDAVVVSSQHSPDISTDELRAGILERVIKPVVPEGLIDADTKIYINPTGRFVVGGPVGDSGVTGRKIIVDTYGGYARHGGGCFSGKDATKVDRSAAYMARYIAKNIVAAGLARECEIQLAYAIGVAHPVSVMIDTFGTGACPDETLAEAVRAVFPLTPSAIIKRLSLKRPIFEKTTNYGHFGREDEGFAWEKTDAAHELLARVRELAPDAAHGHDAKNEFLCAVASLQTMTLATAAGGEVSMREVSPVLCEDKILIFTNADSKKYLQLRENPVCCVRVGDFFAQARAEFLGGTMHEKNAGLRAVYAAKFAGAFKEGDEFGGCASEFLLLTPTRLSGWLYENGMPSSPVDITL